MPATTTSTRANLPLRVRPASLTDWSSGKSKLDAGRRPCCGLGWIDRWSLLDGRGRVRLGLLTT